MGKTYYRRSLYKMNYGPVPSNIKNIIDFSSDIQRNGNILSTVVEYDSDELSVSENKLFERKY